MNTLRNPVIYHIPYGLENLQTGVEDALLRWKGKVPIVGRNYDPHSPIKNSREYLSTHHDLVLTYNEALLGQPGFQFSYLAYDNHLVEVAQHNQNRRRFCSMILGNKYTGGGEALEAGFEVFNHTHLGLRNIYPERDAIAQHREVDVYGRGWPRSMPNYFGALNPFDRKYAIARRHRFDMALENSEGDVYISEKLLDSFLNLCLPVYLGARKVKEHVPPECFIHARDYADTSSLFAALHGMSAAEYDRYVAAIRAQREAIFQKFSSAQNIVTPIYQWYNKSVREIASPTETEVGQIHTDLKRMRLVRNPGARKQALISAFRRLRWRLVR
jgi:hypothetical protein